MGGVPSNTFPRTEPKRLIAGHNTQVLRTAGGVNVQSSYPCECEDGQDVCLFGGNCKTKNIVYKAEVETDGVVPSYIGQTTKTFKQRAGAHYGNIRTGRKATSLATHVIDLRSKGIGLSC